MSMEVRIIDGKLTVNLFDAMSEMKGEERANLIDALACRDEVIDEVMNQVIDGWTSAGSHAGKGLAGHTVYHGIDAAVRRVAKASSAMAAAEIERLEKALQREEAKRNEGWDAYHKLLNSERSWSRT